MGLVGTRGKEDSHVLSTNQETGLGYTFDLKGLHLGMHLLKIHVKDFCAVKDGSIAIARWKEGLPTNSNSDANQDRRTHNSQNNAHEFYEIQHAA